MTPGSWKTLILGTIEQTGTEHREMTELRSRAPILCQVLALHTKPVRIAERLPAIRKDVKILSIII